MLTNKQKSFLRGESNRLQPLVHIGKSGLTESVITQIEEALEAKELIKVTILQNCDQDKNEIAAKLEEQVGIEVVQVIGKIIVLYKESVEKKRIELP
ncbi:MAG TPA: ribosome assembly RNA-binding protein YhbY [Sporosarcina psychrophila]|jgi:RNA-binding protein|uniref:RNA-binding protein n=1 Tax=Sporosarcina psychrophila TaxID=1476 RepID=A0A127VXK5_SPOPS|nr:MULTISPECIES: ribosome assembly RNA-binding protein YhbY [Sporosarcina]AMQ06055.1 RNA-binding protein [Sporosarcina psychrophila]KAA0965410.1 ribosome assembly RNA-binding protein YhbY [Sporosarcina sp. ANT_H38]QNK90020.1 ribosome assembly RNA-binding protein YhbY [Sporosarcina sp. resist]HJF33674.1 ribosome assembly RNA-binding protein YhbY [Sporosarcina psychrophila]